MARLDRLPPGTRTCPRDAGGCGHTVRAVRGALREIGHAPKCSRPDPRQRAGGQPPTTARPPVLFAVPGSPARWERTDGGRRTQEDHAEGMEDVQKVAVAALPARPYIAAGPVLVACTFILPRRQGWSAPIHQSDPDTDNLIKLLLDALSGYAYRDDRQVVGVAPLDPGGWHARYGDDPQTVVRVSAAD